MKRLQKNLYYNGRGNHDNTKQYNYTSNSCNDRIEKKIKVLTGINIYFNDVKVNPADKSDNSIEYLYTMVLLIYLSGQYLKYQIRMVRQIVCI